jgi:hypothetical protein
MFIENKAGKINSISAYFAVNASELSSDWQLRRYAVSHYLN